MNSRVSWSATGGNPLLHTDRLSFAFPRAPAKTLRRWSRATCASPCSRAITIMSATGPTRRSTGWSAICCGRARRSGSIRRCATIPPFRRPATWSTCRRCRSRGGPNIASPRRSAAEVARRPGGVRAQYRPCLEPRRGRPSRGQLGARRAASRWWHRSTRGSRPTCNIIGLSWAEPTLPRDPAAFLPPLRRDRRAGRIDRRGAPRPAHEPRHLDLEPRGRPRPVQSRPAQPGMAARPSGSATRKWWSPSSAGS